MKNGHNSFTISFLSPAQASVLKNSLNKTELAKRTDLKKVRQAALKKGFFRKTGNRIRCLCGVLSRSKSGHSDE